MEVIKQKAIKAASGYNEAEVRFHIIDPIMRKLGYPDSNDVYLNLEVKLEYPYIHIGRRSKKDLPLGFPDYRAGLKGARGSFIVEAKAGEVPITNLGVEQAHSYAAHAQVGANYFVLCNGIEIRVYETLSGSNTSPLAKIPLSEVNDRFHELENILTPRNLAKNCRIEYDSKLKLCDGLGSSVRVRGGEYKIADYAYRIFVEGVDSTADLKASEPQIAALDEQLDFLRAEFELRVSEGLAERDAEGRITASARFAGVTKNNAAAMQLMGIDQMSFVTSEKFLSRDKNNLTMFESKKDFALEKGAMVPQLFGSLIPLESDIIGELFIRAAMYMADEAMRGEYLALTNYRTPLPMGRQMEFELDLAGEFEMRLDV